MRIYYNFSFYTYISRIYIINSLIFFLYFYLQYILSMKELKLEQNIIISTVRKIIQLNFDILIYKNIKFNFLKFYFFNFFK